MKRAPEPGVLALETSTDACSIAVALATGVSRRHSIAPRQHSQRLFQLLDELLPDGDLRTHGIEVVAFGAGPGSFTGLRIAASAAQGLAFSSGLPVVPVSSLSLLAQGALRTGAVSESDTALCVVDARLNEVYAAAYRFEAGLAELCQGPWACAPDALVLQGDMPFLALGNGCEFLRECSGALRERIVASYPDLLPDAQDIIPLARQLLLAGHGQPPAAAAPEYVRDEINWKKLSEQGRPE